MGISQQSESMSDMVKCRILKWLGFMIYGCFFSRQSYGNFLGFTDFHTFYWFLILWWFGHPSKQTYLYDSIVLSLMIFGGYLGTSKQTYDPCRNGYVCFKLSTLKKDVNCETSNPVLPVSLQPSFQKHIHSSVSQFHQRGKWWTRVYPLVIKHGWLRNPTFIWVNYSISLSWILRPFGDDFPYINHDSQWGRAVKPWWNSPRFVSRYGYNMLLTNFNNF